MNYSINNDFIKKIEKDTKDSKSILKIPKTFYIPLNNLKKNFFLIIIILKKNIIIRKK